MILAIISCIELSRNDFLIKVVSEAYILLHSHKIMNQPEETLEQIIQELERDVGSGQAPKQQTPLQESTRIIK